MTDRPYCETLVTWHGKTLSRLLQRGGDDGGVTVGVALRGHPCVCHIVLPRRGGHGGPPLQLLVSGGFENPRHYCENAEMVGIVIGDQKRFPQNRLPVAVQ